MLAFPLGAAPVEATGVYGADGLPSEHVLVAGGEAFEVTALSDAFDTYLEVVAPDGRTYEDDDSGGGLNASVFVPDEEAVAGVWRIRVRGYNGEGAGPYTVVVGSPLDAVGTGRPVPPLPPPHPVYGSVAHGSGTGPGYGYGAGPGDTSGAVTRYPSMEAPSQVAPGQTFTLLVSLSEARSDVTAQVVQGDTTAEGALRLAAPAAEGTRYDVVLHAVGFAIEADTRPLTLRPSGDSTPARFRLTADPETPPGTVRPVHATLWQDDGTFVGRFSRDVRVGDPQALPASAPLRAASAEPASAVPAALPGAVLAPDLTVEMIYGLDPDRPRRARVTVGVGGRPVRATTWDEPEGAGAWIADRLARLAALGGRGVEVEPPDSARTRAAAEGVGAELWERYAPPVVQEAVWWLADRAAEGGPPFEAVQVVTNDATLPWELMRPVRGGRTLGFLGAALDVGRWHVDDGGGRAFTRPEQALVVEGLTLVAPYYDGAGRLPNQARERDELLLRPGAGEVDGTFRGVAAALHQPRPRILHFAGHGAVQPDPGGGYSQVVLLEDGPIDLAEWRGLAAEAGEGPPFVFFNACDVGRTAVAGGFVTGWAETMVASGVGGYVGALWPLGDAAAADFAAAFYDALYSEAAGGRPARALRLARRALYDATGDASHLAYVYYGDPRQRLLFE